VKTLELSQEIIERFNQAIHAARIAGEPEVTAMVLATGDGSGFISSRTVLLKSLDAQGFVFFTNLESNKGKQLKDSPQAAATFLWKNSETQVQIAGRTELIADVEADAYFETRDRGAQLGAWASLQSQVLDSRETLEQRVKQFDSQYEGKPVPRPPHWSGFRLKATSIEFWHGRKFRLHDRFKYVQQDGQWIIERLYP
jgi:pyridoxamine 5'-phosphate oxidase